MNHTNTRRLVSQLSRLPKHQETVDMYTPNALSTIQIIHSKCVHNLLNAADLYLLCINVCDWYVKCNGRTQQQQY